MTILGQKSKFGVRLFATCQFSGVHSFYSNFGSAFCVRNCMKYRKFERIYCPLLISSCDDGAEMEM